MGAQCYAFVRFQDTSTAESLVHRFSCKPLVASGHELRINLAHGQLPDWKVCNGLRLDADTTGVHIKHGPDPNGKQCLCIQGCLQAFWMFSQGLACLAAHSLAVDWQGAGAHVLRAALLQRGAGHGHIPQGQQHPKVLQAQQHGDALAQQLLAAGSHGLDFSSQPTQREMVSYDDL